MRDFFKTIVNSFLAVLFALMSVSAAYYFTSEERLKLLSANILDQANPADIELVRGVTFVNPSGTALPQNGVVTIQSVSVDFTGGSGLTDQNVSGEDINGSFISITPGSIPCPAGTLYTGNQVILPAGFASSCTVGLTVPGHLNINEDDGASPALDGTNELTIEAVSCSDLKTSILRGYGNGFETFDYSVVDLPTAANTDAAFPFDFSSPLGFSSVDINNPTAEVDEDNPVTQYAQTYQIHIDFVQDISLDPVNGVSSRAEIVSNSGDGIYEIKVRDEGTGNEALTALNFAYVFNDLLGSDSPFIAYNDVAAPEFIQLQTLELGTHTNTANNGPTCAVDGSNVAQCFAGGTDGDDGSGDPLGLLALPLTLDNEVVQGDTNIVFADGSFGEIEWISSHPSLLEVTTLSEAAESGDSTVDFVEALLSAVADDPDEDAGSYELTGPCDEEFDDDQPPNLTSQSCEIVATIPVSYDISAENYEANVTVDGEIVNVPLTGTELVGSITATATYTMGVGASFSFNGSVSGPVSGTVAGQFAGAVNGIITTDITAGDTIGDQGELIDLVTQIRDEINLVGGDLSAGVLTEVPDSFTSTVKKEEDDISHVALLYAKRPGTTILTAIDAQGCIATFDLEVIEKKVILEMVGRSPGDVLDVSDTVQINAFTGAANGELDEYENITAASGIEWFSSNEEVATIDETGLLTALKPGVTNITARYDTGEAEIGTIESVPMTVTVNKISGLRITFDEATQDKLPSDVVDAAHGSVIIALHEPEAAGQTLLVEGQSVPIVLPAGDYESDIAKIDAIVNDGTTGLATVIAALVNDALVPVPVVTVTTIDGFPGMLILQPLNQDEDTDQVGSEGYGVENIDENSRMDISSTALLEDFSILPTYSNTIPLPASETYGLQVIAEYDNGATKLLPPTQFNWVNTPLTYLEQASLDSGFIRLGDISGTSTVVAEFENADGSIVQSNYLTIDVDSGPVIEFVRRIGSGSIVKGSRIDLQTKVTDVNTVADIASIETSLVFSNFSTYNEINADATAIWFSATPFLEQVTVESQGGSEGEGEGEGEEGGESGGTTTPPPALQFKTYNIPVEIPVDPGLFDGIYKLIISITDTQNHTLNYVYPIRIGDIGEGDVNGDGVTNMVDVIIAFQIAAGILPNPTPAQLEAANVDGSGGVTLIDVILLFNQVSS